MPDSLPARAPEVPDTPVPPSAPIAPVVEEPLAGCAEQPAPGLVTAGARPPKAWAAHLGAVAYFTVLSIVMTWPLVLRLRDSIVGQIGDNIYFVFLIAWYKKAWFELGISPFFHPWLNYPQGWNLASTDTALSTTLPGLLFSFLGGPVLGYNLAMLLTFVLSGWAMFFWVRRLTGSAAAGLVAGTIYAFLPDRMAHFLAGHLNLAGTQWFPLYFMGLYDILRGGTGKAAWKSIALAAISLGLIGFTSMYYLYYAVLFTAVFVAGYLLFERRAWRERALWLRLAGLGALALPALAAALLPFVNLAGQGGLASRDADLVSMNSAALLDYLLPSTDHFLWGQWVGSHFDRSLWIENTLYLGVVVLALAVLAWWKRSALEHRTLLKIALLVALAAFVLSLGTGYLRWNGTVVQLPVPGFLQPILHHESMPLPLPSRVLFKLLPFFDKMRAMMRIGLVTLLFTSLSAGLGAGWLLRRFGGGRRTIALASLLIALVLFDFYPGPVAQFAPVAGRPVDAWLAQQPGQGSVAQFPFIQVEDQDQVYNTLVHGKPFIGGFFSANQPEQYLRIRPVLEQFPSAEGAALLKELGVQWVLMDTTQYPDFTAARAQVEALGLHYVDTIGAQAVFEFDR